MTWHGRTKKLETVIGKVNFTESGHANNFNMIVKATWNGVFLHDGYFVEKVFNG